jgi:hypothetical protein
VARWELVAGVSWVMWRERWGMEWTSEKVVNEKFRRDTAIVIVQC